MTAAPSADAGFGEPDLEKSACCLKGPLGREVAGEALVGVALGGRTGKVAEERLQPPHRGAILGPRREALKERASISGIGDRHAPHLGSRRSPRGKSPSECAHPMVSIIRVEEALSSDE